MRLNFKCYPISDKIDNLGQILTLICSVSDPDPVGSVYFDRLGSPTVSDFFSGLMLSNAIFFP